MALITALCRFHRKKSAFRSYDVVHLHQLCLRSARNGGATRSGRMLHSWPCSMANGRRLHKSHQHGFSIPHHGISHSRSLHINPLISEAIWRKEPVVALESTIITHGMPFPHNIEYGAYFRCICLFRIYIYYYCCFTLQPFTWSALYGIYTRYFFIVNLLYSVRDTVCILRGVGGCGSRVPILIRYPIHNLNSMWISNILKK